MAKAVCTIYVWRGIVHVHMYIRDDKGFVHTKDEVVDTKHNVSSITSPKSLNTSSLAKQDILYIDVKEKHIYSTFKILLTQPEVSTSWVSAVSKPGMKWPKSRREAIKLRYNLDQPLPMLVFAFWEINPRNWIQVKALMLRDPHLVSPAFVEPIRNSTDVFHLEFS